MEFWDKLKSLRVLYENLTEPVKQKYNLTQLEFDILMFLHNNPQYNTANDIVKVRQLAKSHVSTSISSLEKKGLIERKNNPNNKKIIILKLTSKSNKIISAGLEVQKEYANILIGDLSNSEIKQAHNLFERICVSVDKELNKE